jgi:cytochrome c-type biogenesis protein CcmH
MAQPLYADVAIEARLTELSRELRCVVCQNEALSDSPAELADAMRQEIRDLMKAGKTDQEVLDFLTARYGDFVLFRPPLKPLTYLFCGPGPSCSSPWAAGLDRGAARAPHVQARSREPCAAGSGCRPPAGRPAMNEFWSVALFLALAVAAVALALAFVLPFLLRGRAEAPEAARRDVNLAVYRDQMKDLKAELSESGMSQEQFLANKLELEVRAAEDALAAEDGPPVAPAPAPSRKLAIALAALLPVAAFSMYFWLGNPAVLTAIAAHQGDAHEGAAQAAAEPSPEQIMGMIQQIEARTRSHPSDGAAWEALAMANGLVARWPEAVQAYEKAHQLLPEKPSVLVGYAESLAMAANQVLVGRPIELVNQALQLDPTHTKGLELAVVHAYQTQNYTQAIAYIDRLGRQAQAGSDYAREVMAMRDDAQRRLLALAGGAAAGATVGATVDATAGVNAGANAGAQVRMRANAAQPAQSAASVSGQIDVAEALKPRIGAQATLFVLARSAAGGPPLAAARVPLGPCRWPSGSTTAWP